MSNMTDDSQPLITHLVELRNRLLRCVICILVVFVALVYFSNDIYHFVAAPLTAVMPKGATMIATNIQTPFFLYLICFIKFGRLLRRHCINMKNV